LDGLKMKNNLSIIIPVYNEESAVSETIRQIKAVMNSLNYKYEIIAVDDGSKDKSREILEKQKNIKLIKHPYNLGYGASLKSGIKVATYDWLLITDADATYPIKDIPKLLKYVPGYDMVVGARIGKKRKIPLLRIPAKIILTAIVNFLIERKIPDLNSGFRVFRKDVALEFFHLFPSKFSFTTTLTLAYLTNDYTVKYIPIDYYKRKGKSTIKPNDFVNFFTLITRVITYFKPFRIFFLISVFLFFIAFLVFLYTKIILDQVMDITVIIILIASLQIFLFGLIAELVIKTRER